MHNYPIMRSISKENVTVIPSEKLYPMNFVHLFTSRLPWAKTRNNKTKRAKAPKPKPKRRANQAKSFRGFHLFWSFRFFFFITISQKYFRNMLTIGVTNSLYWRETVAVILRINTPGLIHNLFLENELHMFHLLLWSSMKKICICNELCHKPKCIGVK